jgi:hypothetical protein
MPSNESDSRSLDRRKLGFAAILAGIVIAALSYLPNRTLDGAGWSNEQALKYQETSAKLIGMSHATLAESPDTQSKALADQSRARLRDFSELRDQLDAARKRSFNWAIALRAIGAVIVFVGAVRYFATLRKRSPELREFHKVSS